MTMNFSIQSFRAFLLLVFLAVTVSPVAAQRETPLEKQMAKISKAYKLLGKQARAGTFDHNALARAFADAKLASQAAARLVPAKLAKMNDGSAKKKAIGAYQKDIKKLTKQLAATVAICQKRDDKKLKAALAKLKKAKNAGHDKFTED